MAGTGPAGGDRESSVWGPSYAQQTHCLWVYLARLRRKLEPDTAQYTELDSAVALHARIGRTQPFPDRPDNDERIAAVLGPAYEVQEPIAGRTHPGRITDTAGGIRANPPDVGGLGWSSRGRPPPGWRVSPRHEAVAATVERPGLTQ